MNVSFLLEKGILHQYVPDGFTAESYKKFNTAEAKKNATKNLGKLGPRVFKLRSFQSFQEALERGEAEHFCCPSLTPRAKLRRMMYPTCNTVVPGTIPTFADPAK